MRQHALNNSNQNRPQITSTENPTAVMLESDLTKIDDFSYKIYVLKVTLCVWWGRTDKFLDLFFKLVPDFACIPSTLYHASTSRNHGIFYQPSVISFIYVNTHPSDPSAFSCRSFSRSILYFSCPSHTNLSSSFLLSFHLILPNYQ